MNFKEIMAIIIIFIFLIFYAFMILRMYILVMRIDKDNKKLKKFLRLFDKKE